MLADDNCPVVENGIDSGDLAKQSQKHSDPEPLTHVGRKNLTPRSFLGCGRALNSLDLLSGCRCADDSGKYAFPLVMAATSQQPARALRNGEKPGKEGKRRNRGASQHPPPAAFAQSGNLPADEIGNQYANDYRELIE